MLAALRAATSSEPDLELLGEVPDAAAALHSDAEVTRVVALVDVSDAEETDLELVGLLSRRHLWWVVAMSVRSGLRAVSEAAGAAAFWSKERGMWRRASAIRSAALSSSRQLVARRYGSTRCIATLPRPGGEQ